jgi:tetraacyldisaccharide 4'-kinase
MVFVGKNRLKLAKLAIEKGARCVILDDAMQHRKLFRDLEIVMVHADNPWGGGHFLPRGMLRDSKDRLKKADWIVIHGAGELRKFELLEEEIRRYTSAPIIGTRYIATNGEQIKGEKIGAFCGIGAPESFYQMLTELSCEIVDRKTLPDHTPFEEAMRFVQTCKKKGASKIVCTEKDYIKLRITDSILPLYVTMKVVYGHNHYTNLLACIGSLMNTNYEECL